MRAATGWGSLLWVAAALVGCGSTASPTDAAPSATASSSSSPAPSKPKEPKPPWIGVEGPVAPLQSLLDPKNQGPYGGPTARLHGKITITGDPPALSKLTFPKECPDAEAVFGKLFRVDASKGLADVLVAVTGFEGFVPAKSDAVTVTIKGCGFDRRTVALAVGQRLDVRNLDAVTSYTPFLDGSEYSALRVAVPRGLAVPLSTRRPGQYLLRDAMQRPFMLADVFVLKYATTAITALDGTYAIEGLPVGKVRVDALLPVLRKTTGKDVELKEGDNQLDLELKYDAKVDQPVLVPDAQIGTRDNGVNPVAKPTPTAAPSP